MGLAGAHVAGQGLGDLVGMGEFHVFHVAHEIPLAGVAAQPGVEGLLLRYGGNAAACVVVPRIEQTAVGEAEDLLGD